MPATLRAAALPDTSAITRLLRHTKLLLRSSWGATGLGLTAGMALTVLVAVTVVDMLAPLVGPWFRLTGLLLFAVPTAWVFLVGVVLPLLRRLGPVELARRIEARIPGMHSRLVSCVDLGRKGAAEASPAFYRRLVDESLERIRDYRAASIVDWRSVRNALLFALVGGALFAVLWFGFGERLPTALARVFRPFADIPPASGVVYTVRPGTAKVLAGEDVVFTAHVSRGEPDGLRLELYSPDPAVKPMVHTLEKGEKGDWTRALQGLTGEKGFENGFSYRVFGGGTWTRLQHITWIERPVLLDTHVRVHHPAYMAIPEPKVNPPKVRDVTGPEGGDVEVTVEADGQVAKAEVQVLENRLRRIPVAHRRERVWLGRDLPAGAQPTGSWQWVAQSEGRGRVHTNPSASGTAGHGFGHAADAFPVHRSDVLFAHVYLHPLDPPTAIMLQWADETGGEHRAYWGEDRFGERGTPGLLHVGPLPAAGQWVRLEVPSAAVGLEGKPLRGMAFFQFGGKVSWHQAGASLPSFTEQTEAVPVGSFPLHAVGDDGRHWSGRFPLKGKGAYRVRLTNELGYANKPEEKDPTFEAVPDRPPEVLLERPGADLVLSQPQKVPLQVAVRDDYGLADVWLATRKEGELRFGRVQPLREYSTPNPLRAETFVAPLDLEGLGVKVGDTLHYRVEARDRRPNSESVKSKEFAVRVVADPNAADKQLEAFERSQDPFRDKLLKLIGDQAKVREKIEQVQARHEALDRKVREAVAEAESRRPKAEPGQPEPKAPEPKLENKLDPKELKELEDLRKELNELFRQEAQNVQLAQQAGQDLANSVNQAARLPLLNDDVAKELKNLQDLFNQAALNPLQDLAQRLQQGGQAPNTPPDLKDLKRRGDRLQRELEALKNRADALADAQKGLKSNSEAALEKLRNDMLRERGNLTARELADLKEFLQQLREELARTQGKQQDLADQTDKAPDGALPEIEKKQLTVDEVVKRDLERAKRMLERERARRMKRPNLPDEPFSGDKERTAPPAEEDGPDADANKKKDGNDPDGKDDPAKTEKKDGDDKEDLFMPALGEKVKTDARFAKKRRPSPKKDGDDPQSRREGLRDRQDDNLEGLDAAQKALRSDENALERMMRGLLDQSQKASRPNGKSRLGEGDESADALRQLRDMLQSDAMKRAMAMAQRARQSSQQRGPNQPGQNPNASQPNFAGTPPGGTADADLGSLDAPTRTMLLQMQPREREELLQAMREEGPEGYRKFIQDYFKRLSESRPRK